MLPKFSRKVALALALAPLVLGLAACSKTEESKGSLSGEVVAKVAAPAGKVWSDVVSLTPNGGYLIGNPQAPIKLAEYAALSCSHCAEFSEKGSAALRDTFVATGRVSYELRTFVRDPIDLATALLARCGSPESFFALADQGFANQAAMFKAFETVPAEAKEAIGTMAPDKRLVEVARMAGPTDFYASRGISSDQGNACLANVAEAEKLSKGAAADAEKYKIEGTPTFLINGSSIGSMGWEELKAKLETMGAR